MTHTIISKRTTPFVYTKFFADAKKNIIKPLYSILINGGAGVVGGTELLSGKPMAERSLLTSQGVATLVNDDTLTKLMDIPKFRSDIKRGLILVLKRKQVTSQDAIDNIAEKEMIEGDHIPTRPISQSDLENVGARFVEDENGEEGLGVNITKMNGSPIETRNAEAGLPGYVKKRRRNARNNQQDGVFVASAK